MLDRDGRIIGIIPGGTGPTDETDMTYITSYYWLVGILKQRYPGCHLCDIVPDEDVV